MLEYVSLPPVPSISFIPLKSTNQSSALLAPLSFSTALTYLYSFSLPPAASLMGSALLVPDPLLTPLSFLAEMQFSLSPINISCHGAVPGEQSRLEEDPACFGPECSLLPHPAPGSVLGDNPAAAQPLCPQSGDTAWVQPERQHLPCAVLGPGHIKAPYIAFCNSRIYL